MSRLNDHLTNSKLLNPSQSAYRKLHSTETVLLSLHDHLIDAIGSQSFQPVKFHDNITFALRFNVNHSVTL